MALTTIANISEEMAELQSMFADAREFHAHHKQDLDRNEDVQGICAYGFITHKMKAPEGLTPEGHKKSQMFEMVVSTFFEDHQKLSMGESISSEIYEIPVENSKDKSGNESTGSVNQKPDTYPVQKFTAKVFSTRALDELKDIPVAVGVLVRGIRAKWGIKDRIGKVYLNAAMIERCNLVSAGDILEHLKTLPDQKLTTPLKRCTVVWAEKDVKTHYDSSQDIRLLICPETINRAVERNEPAVMLQTDSLTIEHLKTKSKTNEEKTCVRIDANVWQCDGPKFSRENITQVITRIQVWNELVESTFKVCQPLIWQKIGINIWKWPAFNALIYASVYVKNTNQMTVNTKTNHGFPFAFGLSLNVNSILANVGAAYIANGITVTKEHALKHLAKEIIESPDQILKGTLSKKADPLRLEEVMSLSEHRSFAKSPQDPTIGQILAIPEVRVVAMIDRPMDDVRRECIASLTPEEGVLLLTGCTKATLLQRGYKIDHPLVRLAESLAFTPTNRPIFYLFAILSGDALRRMALNASNAALKPPAPLLLPSPPAAADGGDDEEDAALAALQIPQSTSAVDVNDPEYQKFRERTFDQTKAPEGNENVPSAPQRTIITPLVPPTPMDQDDTASNSSERHKKRHHHHGGKGSSSKKSKKSRDDSDDDDE